MNAKVAPDAGADSGRSTRPRRKPDAREGAHNDHETDRLETAVYVLPNSVVVSKPDHVRVETTRETFYRAPLDDTTRKAFEVVTVDG